ncbi:MAG: LemA family protein, partial [Deltaproteobacteria bacterium]|nr:LemA family protein [Deltaproteobacteria bacterium]
MKLITVLLITPLLTHCGYNSLQGYDEDVKAAWAEVENQYQRRHDLVPNLVEVVKGYAKHEKDTLEAVTNARAKATQTVLKVDDLSNPQAFQKFQAAQGELSQALSRLMVASERYPDLKANEHFRDLQAQLEGTENRITVARNRYIESVAVYNKGVRFFPTNLTAQFLLHLKERETFSTSAEVKQA